MNNRNFVKFEIFSSFHNKIRFCFQYTQSKHENTTKFAHVFPVKINLDISRYGKRTKPRIHVESLQLSDNMQAIQEYFTFLFTGMQRYMLYVSTIPQATFLMLALPASLKLHRIFYFLY